MKLIFQQLFESETSTFTYILGCEKTKEAVIIDPVLETVDRDLKLIGEMGLKLVYVLDTHIHADHVTAAGEIRKRLAIKTVVGSNSKVDCADISLAHKGRLKFGEHEIVALHTPGHTDSCTSYFVGDRVFTGDALLIRGCGRTDFQQGSSSTLYDSVHQNLFTLPPETTVYPAHDYKGFTSSTIKDEMNHNPRLGIKKSKDDFIKIMSELKLANPKNMAAAVPANLACGVKA